MTRLTVAETDLLIDALEARASRYSSMAANTASLDLQNKYEARGQAMRALRSKLAAIKARNETVAV